MGYSDKNLGRARVSPAPPKARCGAEGTLETR